MGVRFLCLKRESGSSLRESGSGERSWFWVCVFERVSLEVVRVCVWVFKGVYGGVRVVGLFVAS